MSQHAILPEDVKKIIEAADRDDYPAIVVGEHHLAIHHYTDEVYEIFAKGLGVDCEIFLTDVNELGDEQVLQVPAPRHQGSTVHVPACPRDQPRLC